MAVIPKPMSLKGKTGYIEIRVHEGVMRACESPNLILSMDVEYFIIHPKQALNTIAQEVGSALIAMFQRDYSAYPKLGDKIAAAEAGIHTPEGSVISPHTEKVIEYRNSGK